MRVNTPKFELAGPPCKTPGCNGVLVDTLCLKTQEVFKRCSKCKQEFYRMSAKDALGWATREIDRTLKGEKDN